MNESNTTYRHWFVLQVKSKREYLIKNLLEKHANAELKMIVFSRELIFRRNNSEFKCLSPLFPSYIFVHKNVDKVLAAVKKNCMDELIKPLCFRNGEERCKVCFGESAPCQVLEREMEFLLNNADETGRIGLSYGIEKKGQIEIINGPLKYLHPDILWINKKKKKACVEIELFKRKMKVNLGLKLLT